MDNINHLNVSGLDDTQLVKLDHLAIRGQKAIAVRLALGAELFIPPPGKEQTINLYRNLFTCIKNYYTSFKDNLNYYIPPNATRISKISGDPFPRWDTAFKKLDEDYGFGMDVFYNSSRDEGIPIDATPWQVSALGNRPSDSDLSAIRASIPVCNAQKENNFGVLFGMTLKWCERLKPVHGSSGFCVSYRPDMEPQTQWSWPLLQRYPGVDQQDIVEFSLRAGGIYNRIKGINWLTVLGDAIVSELGGKESIKRQLGELCSVHSYDGGIIIIAGPIPQLGDVYSGFIPERYKTVASLTHPVRFERYTRPFIRLRKPLDSMEATLKWIRRFD
ncbi:DUF3396 domain-containing protein [Salmonella enterica]|nr:DUF3396 domain-containing protein [Salmonella enterica subsp. enterica]EKT1335419.1 DUF3396 domain-containing protein [Salmonella enterica]